MDEEKIVQNEEQERKPLSETKKTAVLRYMTVLFAVAFTLVLVSFFVQTARLNETSSSAMANAELLQDQNRQLQEELALVKAENEALGKELSDLADAAEQDAAQAAKRVEHTKEAYDALMTAMDCTKREGNVTFAKSMEVLRKYNDLLSEQAQEIYQSLLEQ